MTLLTERLYILRCSSGQLDTAFIYDPDLRSQVQRLLTELESVEDRDRPGLVHKLIALYDTHGPGVWKCVLELSYLLHTTSEA